MARVRLIQGKGDWEATPPTGASDADLYQLANDMVASGGVLRPENGEGLVTENSTPSMDVLVAPGVIYVENAAWTATGYEPKFYQVVRPDVTTVTISSNPSGQTRYDAIVQEIDKVTEPNDDADNVCPITYVEGTPGSMSIDIPDNSELLGVIEVVDGATVITNSSIADYRRKVVGIPGFISPDIQVYDDASTVTFDCGWGYYNKFFVTLGGNRTIAFTNLPAGFPVTVHFQQGSGGNKVPNISGDVITTDGEALEFSTDAGAIDHVGFILLPTGDIQVTMISPNLQ